MVFDWQTKQILFRICFNPPGKNVRPTDDLLCPANHEGEWAGVALVGRSLILDCSLQSFMFLNK